MAFRRAGCTAQRPAPARPARSTGIVGSLRSRQCRAHRGIREAIKDGRDELFTVIAAELNAQVPYVRPTARLLGGASRRGARAGRAAVTVAMGVMTTRLPEPPD